MAGFHKTLEPNDFISKVLNQPASYKKSKLKSSNNISQNQPGSTSSLVFDKSTHLAPKVYKKSHSNKTICKNRVKLYKVEPCHKI
ncbi:hypothetical protein L1887_19956 [Cichorium endivia]|nr:hypothetical protein L1887_19956 [Cichorium endivia]